MKNFIRNHLDHSHRAGIARGLTSDMAAKIVAFLLNLWTVGICVHVLGGIYGSWLAGIALLSIFSFLDLGFGPFLIRETAELWKRGASSREWSNLFSTVLCSFLAIMTAVLLLGWSLAPHIASFVSDGKSSVSELTFALQLGTVSIALTLPLGMWHSLVNGVQRLGTLGFLSVIESSAHAFSVTVLLWQWKSVQALPIAMLITMAIYSASAYFCTPQKIRRAVMPPVVPDRKIFKNMVAYCRPLIAARICHAVKDRTDEPIAARFLGPEAVVIFTVTQKLVRSVQLFILGSLSMLCFAPLSEVLTSGEKERVRSAVLDSMRWLVLFGLSTTALVWAINPIFVHFWVGGERFGGDLLSLVFCVWFLMELMSRSLRVVLPAAGRQSMMVRALASEAVLNLVISLILVRPLGLLGIALGTAVASMVSTSWAIPRAVFLVLGISFRDFQNTLRGLFMAKSILLAVAIVSSRLLIPRDMLIVGLIGPCVVAIFLGLALFRRELGALPAEFRSA